MHLAVKRKLGYNYDLETSFFLRVTQICSLASFHFAKASFFGVDLKLSTVQNISHMLTLQSNLQSLAREDGKLFPATTNTR